MLCCAAGQLRFHQPLRRHAAALSGSPAGSDRTAANIHQHLTLTPSSTLLRHQTYPHTFSTSALSVYRYNLLTIFRGFCSSSSWIQQLCLNSGRLTMQLVFSGTCDGDSAPCWPGGRHDTWTNRGQQPHGQGRASLNFCNSDFFPLSSSEGLNNTIQFNARCCLAE